MFRLLSAILLAAAIGGLFTSCGTQPPSAKAAHVVIEDDLGRTWEIETTGTDVGAAVTLTPPAGVSSTVFGTVQYDDDGNAIQTDLASGLTVAIERHPDAAELWVVAEDEATHQWVAQQLSWD